MFYKNVDDACTDLCFDNQTRGKILIWLPVLALQFISKA